MSTIVDLRPFIEAVAGVLASALLAVGSIAVHKLSTFLAAKTGNQNLVNEDAVRTYMHTALDNAVKYAVTKVGSANWAQIDTKNALTAAAADYALGHIPDALTYFKVDQAGLEKLILSKIAALDPALGLSAPSASSATAPTANATVNVTEPTT